MRSSRPARLASRHKDILRVYAITTALALITSLTISGFGSGQNLKYLAISAEILGLVAAGETLVVLGGGIDLSIPWTLTGAAEIAGSMSGSGRNGLIVLLTVLAFGIGVGTFNGIGVTVLGVPPLVMTLATNTILSGGIGLVVSTGSTANAPGWAHFLAWGRVAGLPAPILLILLLLVGVSLFLKSTPMGRRLYGVGASPLASSYVGISVRRVRLYSYVLSAVFASLAGIVLYGFTGQASNGMGDPYLFPAIVAVVVGGVSILGGRGTYVGVVGGVWLITVLQASLQAYGLPLSTITVLYGLVILVSAYLAQTSLRGARAASLVDETTRFSPVEPAAPPVAEETGVSLK